MPPRIPQYLNFDIQIEADGQGGYLASVMSPAGETRAAFQLPFSEAQLENRLLRLQKALMRGPSNRVVLSPEEQAVQEFGQVLFESLMTVNVRALYDVSRSQAAHEDKGVRLRLHISPPELASLPREFLYDARQRVYLCRQKDTPLVRYLDVAQPVPALTVSAPLRILAMIANPSDVHPLDTDRERRRMESSLGKLIENGQIELAWVEGGNWRDLQRMLWHGPWHVFHYIGHGGFDTRTDEGMLAFEGDDGRMQIIHARDLADLLAGERSVRFVFLNACLGAAGSDRDVFASTAATLVLRGIPAVQAMQYEITDKAAIEFGRTFYEALAEGLPVDTASTMARQAIHFGVPNSLEWGTPVLYSRAPTGVLFTIAPGSATPVPPPPVKPMKSDQPARYADATRLYEGGRYEEALAMLVALQEQQYKPRVGTLEDAIERVRHAITERDAEAERQRRAAEAAEVYAELASYVRTATP